jgi:membrane protease YdiL (CAAX protease family)
MRNPALRRPNVVVFLLLAFGIAWVIVLALPASVPFGLRGALAMLAPAAAAAAVRGPLFREGFGDAGLETNITASWRIYAIAYALMPVLIFAGFCLSAALGVQHWGIQPLDVIVKSFGVNITPPPGADFSQRLPLAAVVIMALAGLSVSIPINMIFTFGEEFGWRGYLLVRLAPLGRTNAALLVGIIWGLWHAPLIAAYGYVYPGHPIAGIFMMVLYTTPMSIIFAWFRFKSNSVWPSTLAHAANNAQAMLAYIVLSPADSLLRPPAGIIALLPLFIAATWIVATKRLEEREGGSSLEPAFGISPER